MCYPTTLVTRTSSTAGLHVRCRLVTTPNGMLMGLGGNWIQKQFSRQGGTAWGDIFMVNVDDSTGAAHRLRQILQSGHAWYTDDNGKPFESNLALDRVLHHEELHSEQWAAKGHAGMVTSYIWEVLRDKVFGKTNRLEEDAGLSDGATSDPPWLAQIPGYRARIPL